MGNVIGDVLALAVGPDTTTCSLRPSALPVRVAFDARGIANEPEWNVRLRPWGGREGHDYGRNDQS